jgi:hypothetical protein
MLDPPEDTPLQVTVGAPGMTPTEQEAEATTVPPLWALTPTAIW